MTLLECKSLLENAHRTSRKCVLGLALGLRLGLGLSENAHRASLKCVPPSVHSVPTASLLDDRMLSLCALLLAVGVHVPLLPALPPPAELLPAGRWPSSITHPRKGLHEGGRGRGGECVHTQFSSISHPLNGLQRCNATSGVKGRQR
jgi:hypothetical protein